MNLYILGDGPTKPYYGLKTNKSDLTDQMVIGIIAKNGAEDISILQMFDVFKVKDESLMKNWVEHYF